MINYNINIPKIQIKYINYFYNNIMTYSNIFILFFNNFGKGIRVNF